MAEILVEFITLEQRPFCISPAALWVSYWQIGIFFLQQCSFFDSFYVLIAKLQICLIYYVFNAKIYFSCFYAFDFVCHIGANVCVHDSWQPQCAY